MVVMQRQVRVGGRRGGDRGARGAFVGSVARVPGGLAEARVRAGAAVVAHRGGRGGPAGAVAAVRRPAPAPALHAAAFQGLRRGGADRGLALPPGPRPLPRAPHPPIPPRLPPETATAGEEEGGAEAVRGAARGHGVPPPHLRRGVRGGGAHRPGAAAPLLHPLPQPRHLRRPPAAHPPLRGLRPGEEAAAWLLPELQAPVAAPTAPRLHLQRA